MPNGTYGGVRGKETKVGQKTFVSRPTRFLLRLLFSTEGISRGKRPPHVSIDSAFYDLALLAVAESKEVDAR